MNIKQVLCALEKFAPLPLQESWDNAGLQVGLTEAEVSGALLCLDVTEAIIDEALANGCNLIVSHHPLLFRGLKQIVNANMVQRCVSKAIKNDVAVISMHTNLDNAKGGVNFKIAEKLGLADISFIAAKQVGDIEAGSGIIGSLPTALSATDFLQLVKQRFGVACVQANELLRRPISRVAICGGAGDFLADVAVAEGADAFITGEMHYHQFFDFGQLLQLCVIGHYQSEQFTTEVFRDILRRELPTLPTTIATTNTNPIIYL